VHNSAPPRDPTLPACNPSGDGGRRALIPDAPLLCRSGEAASRQGRQQDALTLFREAIIVDPRYAPAWSGAGYVLGKLGRYAEEIMCCDRAVELDPLSSHGLAQQGLCTGEARAIRREDRIV